MSESTAQVTADAAQKVTDKAFQYIEQFEKVIADYGPEVAATALDVVQIHGGFKIGLAFAFLLVGIVLLVAAFFVWKQVGKDDNTSEEEGGLIFLGVSLTLGAVASVAISVAGFTTLSYWMALFSPKGALMYKLMQSQGII